jgi:hypothetical protein
MGVPIGDKRAFQTTLREVILEARRLYEASPDHLPAVAATLLRRLGMATARPFVSWARGAFLGYHADQPEWSAWDIVFSHWAYSRSGDLDFLPAQQRDAFITGYREKAATDDVKQKGEELLEKQLSAWDLETFARQGYGSTWESSPYSTAEAIIRIERLKKFVNEVWNSLTPTDREELQRRAQELINQLKVWMPGALPRLDVLLRQA